MATCAPSAMKSRAVARPMPLLPPVIRAFLPVSFMMPPFCHNRPTKYDDRHTYDMMAIIDGGCRKSECAIGVLSNELIFRARLLCYGAQSRSPEGTLSSRKQFQRRGSRAQNVLCQGTEPSRSASPFEKIPLRQE